MRSKGFENLIREALGDGAGGLLNPWPRELAAVTEALADRDAVLVRSLTGIADDQLVSTHLVRQALTEVGLIDPEPEQEPTPEPEVEPGSSGDVASVANEVRSALAAFTGTVAEFGDRLTALEDLAETARRRGLI